PPVSRILADAPYERRGHCACTDDAHRTRNTRNVSTSHKDSLVRHDLRNWGHILLHPHRGGRLDELALDSSASRRSAEACRDPTGAPFSDHPTDPTVGSAAPSAGHRGFSKRFP